MWLLLVLSILVSGFVVFLHHPYYFFRLHRFDGQLLYLKSAYLGALCTLFAFLGILLFDFLMSSATGCMVCSEGVERFLGMLSRTLAKLGFRQDDGLFLMTVAMGSLVVAFAWVALARALVWYRYRRVAGTRSPQELYKLVLMSGILRDSPMDELFLRSYRDGDVLMLHMEDRKVYVGRVMHMGEPTESEGLDQEIRVFPLSSGYRDKDTLKVTLTTYYDPAKEIAITLRQDKVIAGTVFDEEVFQDFMRKERERERKTMVPRKWF